MLKEQHRFFRSVLIGADMAVVASAAVLAYYTRFYWIESVYPPLESKFSYATHGIPLLLAAPVMLLVMMAIGLYQPRRDQRFYAEAWVVIKAVVIGTLLLLALLTAFRRFIVDGRNLSALQYFFFAGWSATLLLTWRCAFRLVLRFVRSRGWNLRHVAIIGTGRLGQVVFHTLMRNTWTGIKPSFFVSHQAETTRRSCQGLTIRGGLDQLESVLDAHPGLSGVFIALPGRLATQLPEIMQRLERYPLDVRVIPDMNPKYLPINMAASDLDGMPVLSIRESPLNGWGRVTKRTLDLVGAMAAMAIFAVPMLVIALLVRMSGPGPIIFRQERMTLNGQRFKIFKFRTMQHISAEQQAVRDAGKGTDAWTQDDDPRITTIGRFLRRFSLDELPQLFNVLIGEMSLVGPRPERPELIERFREDWRGYMLRQNVKAGITGWAQVNGLRGNTSLRKRLQYDLFYVRNWSLMFDVRILVLTVFRGFSHPNAY